MGETNDTGHSIMQEIVFLIEAEEALEGGTVLEYGVDHALQVEGKCTEGAYSVQFIVGQYDHPCVPKG